MLDTPLLSVILRDYSILHVYIYRGVSAVV